MYKNKIKLVLLCFAHKNIFQNMKTLKILD